MKEFKGCNGAKIVINEAPWGDVRKLKKVLAIELLKLGIDIDKEFLGQSEENLMVGSKLFQLLKDVYLTLVYNIAIMTIYKSKNSYLMINPKQEKIITIWL